MSISWLKQVRIYIHTCIIYLHDISKSKLLAKFNGVNDKCGIPHLSSIKRKNGQRRNINLRLNSFKKDRANQSINKWLMPKSQAMPGQVRVGRSPKLRAIIIICQSFSHALRWSMLVYVQFFLLSSFPFFFWNYIPIYISIYLSKSKKVD